jgi:hypothetical protein
MTPIRSAILVAALEISINEARELRAALAASPDAEVYVPDLDTCIRYLGEAKADVTKHPVADWHQLAYRLVQAAEAAFPNRLNGIQTLLKSPAFFRVDEE